MTPETVETEDAVQPEGEGADAALALPDDSEPDARFKEIALGAAVAEALKPIAPATEEIWSPDPARKQVRDALQKAYATATEAEGPLRVKYDAAMASFVRAATDLLSSSGGGKSRLETWIAAYLDKGKPIHALFTARAVLVTRLKPRSGIRERKLGVKRTATARYAEAHKGWSDPVAAIDAAIGGSAGEIDQLNADINLDRNADHAIYRLWFDHAPRLLQLSPTKVEGTVPGLDKITAALGDFPERIDALKSGADRNDGSLYLADAAKLPQVREAVLDAWKAAAKEQAEAEAAFTLRPDDTAALAARLDAATKGEGDAAKMLLVQPANP